MVDLGWLLPILAILNFFLFLAWHSFSHKKDFFDQYSPMNDKIRGVLVEDFYESVNKWASDRRKKGEKEELGKLNESLKGLSAKSERLSSWIGHIERGNVLLRKVAYNMVLTGVLLSSAVIVFALLFDNDVSLGVLLLFIIGYFGLVFLSQGIKDWRAFCKIESKIDKNYTDLTLGKSTITKRNEEDEEEE
jgi:hypothetical protein